MNRQQRVLFYALVILITIVTVSCSNPAENATRAQSAPVASAESTQPAPPVSNDQPKPVDEVVKKRPAEPARPAAAPRPVAPAAPPAPAPSPAAQQPVATAPSAPAPIVVPAPHAAVPVPPPVSAEPATKQVTIPAGTEIYVRTIDSINTDDAHPNENFRASLDKAVVVDGQTIIPRRADVMLKVVEAQQAGKFSGQSQLKVQLDRLYIGKQSYTVTSNTFTETGSSEGKKAARNIGVGAAVGGILGGILGGKKGAIIGAGAGGGGGAVITKPEPVRVAPETQLLFKLENPLEVTITPGSPTPATTSGSEAPVRFAPR